MMLRVFAVCARAVIACDDDDDDDDDTAVPCLEAGDPYAAKQLNHAECCEGLTGVASTFVPVAIGDGQSRCELQGAVDSAVCVACGDGVCDAYEDICRCPDDCTA